MKGIGAVIRQLREDKGISLNELARRSNIAPANISRFETGQQSIKVNTLDALLRGLGLTLGEFFATDAAKLPTGIRIPLLCLEQVGGYLLNMGKENITAMIEVPETPGASRFIAISICDVSMTGPRDYFKPGEVIIVDPSIRPEPGDYVLALVDGKGLFRQYKLRQNQIELAPLNSFWPTITLPLEEAVIVGTMVEHRRYRKPEVDSPLSLVAHQK